MPPGVSKNANSLRAASAYVYTTKASSLFDAIDAIMAIKITKPKIFSLGSSGPLKNYQPRTVVNSSKLFKQPTSKLKRPQLVGV